MMFLELVGLLAFLLFLGVSVTVTKTVSGFVNANDSATISDNEGITAQPTSILAAQPATLTTRTTNTAGTLTMTNATHGIITGQRVDLYWTGGQCYGAVVGTVAGASVPIASVSGGSVLPAATTPITVGICISTPCNITGNNLSMIAMKASQSAGGYFVFSTGGTDNFAQFVVSARMYEWDNSSPGTNPLAGVVPTQVWMSHNLVGTPVSDMAAYALTH